MGKTPKRVVCLECHSPLLLLKGTTNPHSILIFICVCVCVCLCVCVFVCKVGKQTFSTRICGRSTWAPGSYINLFHLLIYNLHMHACNTCTNPNLKPQDCCLQARIRINTITHTQAHTITQTTQHTSSPKMAEMRPAACRPGSMDCRRKKIAVRARVCVCVNVCVIITPITLQIH